MLLAFVGAAGMVSAQDSWEERFVSGIFSDALRTAIGDLDGDGTQDILLAAGGPGRTDTLYLLENRGGSFRPPAILWQTLGAITSLRIVDLDADGLPDILTGEGVESEAIWIRNRGPALGFGSPMPILQDFGPVGGLTPVDLDADGDLDLILNARSTSVIQWARHADGAGTFETPEFVTSEIFAVVELQAGDLDGDGDVDFAAAGASEDRALWFPNDDGLGTFGPSRTITDARGQAGGMRLVDLDVDGDLDVVGADLFDEDIGWYPNEDGLGTFGLEISIQDQAGSARSIELSDADGDGDVDLLWGSTDDALVYWTENIDGQGSFGATRPVGPVDPGAIEFSCGDLDGDLDLDVLIHSAQSSRVEWASNSDGAGTFGPPVRLSQAPTEGPVDALATDLDGDGTLDLVCISELDDQLAWYPNPLSAATFETQVVLPSPGTQPAVLVAGDLDGDADADLVVANADGTIVRYDNSDAAGNLLGPLALPASQDTPEAAALADLDGDGDLDLVVASSGDDTAGWYENQDGLADFAPVRVITSTATGLRTIAVGDVDGDGDLDVMTADDAADTLAWQENLDGSAASWQEITLSPTRYFVDAVELADIDRDGDLDLVAGALELVGFSTIDRLGWFENLDGQGVFADLLPLSDPVERAFDLAVFDVDADGDLDVATAETGHDSFGLYEHLDGLGRSWAVIQVADMVDGASSIFAADLDGDGAEDLLTTSDDDDHLAWHRSNACGGDPRADFLATPRSGDAPLTVDFTDSSTGTGLSAWRWDFGDGQTSSLQSPTVTFEETGAFDVTLTVTGTFGSCTELRRAFVQVGCGAASAAERNGSGSNASILTSLSGPLLGSGWDVRVDATGHLPDLAYVLVYPAPFEGLFIAGGEVLVDVTMPLLGSTSTTHPGAAIDLTVPIPNDLALCATTASAQALVLGSPGYELSNAYDIVFGQF